MSQEVKQVSYYRTILYMIAGGVLGLLLPGAGLGGFLLGSYVGCLFVPWNRDNWLSRVYKYTVAALLIISLVTVLAVTI